MATGGGIVSLSALGLSGCGGFLFGGSGSGPGGISGVGINVTVTLPSGLDPKKMSVLNGWGSRSDTSGVLPLRGLKGGLTLTLVTEVATGKLVLVGMLNDSTSNSLDATNMAATLIFLNMGGVQTPTSWRYTVWSALLVDPATRAFAALVQNRFGQDAYALEHQDPQLLAGLKLALAGLSQATIATLNQPPDGHVQHQLQQRQPTLRQLPSSRATLAINSSGFLPDWPDKVIPSPDVYLTPKFDQPYPWVNAETNFYFQATFFGVTGENGNFTATPTQDFLEHAFYVLETSRTDSNGSVIPTSPFNKVSGPFGIATTSLPAAKPWVTLPLAQAEDKGRGGVMVLLSPGFNGKIAAPTPDVAPYVAEWTTILGPLYQRAMLGLAAYQFGEALGRGGSSFTREQLAALVQSLAATGSRVSQTLQNALTPTDLVTSVDDIIDACVSDSQVDLTAHVLAPILGSGTGSVTNSLLKATYRLTHFNDYFIFNQGFVARSLNAAAPILAYGFNATGLVYLPTSEEFYSPTGDTVILTLFQTGARKSPPWRSYHWKLTGAGGGLLLDDVPGSTGSREFDSKSPIVFFKPSPNCVGDQVVTVKIFCTEADPPVYVGKATFTLSQSSAVITPGNQTVLPNAQLSILAKLSSIAPPGATYTWSVIGNGTISPAPGVKSTSPNAVYTAPATYEVDTVSVAIKDAAGNSLGTANTTVTIAIESRITPHNPALAHLAKQTFTVSPLAGNFPTGSTYSWTLSGNGGIGGPSPIVTTSPSIQYTAPKTDTVDTLLVTVKNSTGNVISTAGSSITIGGLGVLVVAKDAGTVNGINLVRVFVYITTNRVDSATLYRINLTGLPWPYRDLTRSEYDRGATPIDLSRLFYQGEHPYVTADYHGDFFFNVGGGVIGYLLGDNTGPADQEASITADLKAFVFRTYNPSWTVA